MKSLNLEKLTRIFIPIFFLILLADFHLKAGFVFPTPWWDEAPFLWQAASFADSNNLTAPQLNSERPILWMTPGYMVVTGLIYKITGFSFQIARHLSFLYMVLSFIILCKLYEDKKLKLLFISLTGIFYCSGSFVAAGNIARMEALLLLCLTSGFLLLEHNHIYKSASILCLSVLIHPNGLIFLSLGSLFIFKNFISLQKKTPSLLDWVSIIVTTILWLAYVGYILRHYEHFISDMHFQFSRKTGRGILSQFYTPQSITIIVATILIVYVSCLLNLKNLLIHTFAICCWLTMRIGQEMWYVIFDSLFFLIMSITCIQIAYEILNKYSNYISGKWKMLSIYAISFFITLVLIFIGKLHLSIRDPLNFKWEGLKQPCDSKYITKEDIEKVSQYLKEYQTNDNTIYVSFRPISDSLFFKNIESGSVKISCPIFYKQKADIQILHVSTISPESPKFEFDQSNGTILSQRNNNEYWVARENF